MLTLKKIRKSFATRRILNGVSFSLGDGQKVALVGQNGIGKSTLLKIIAGLEAPDRGEVVLKKGALVGYLPQETVVYSKETVLEYLKRLGGIEKIEKKMQALESRLASKEAQEEYDLLEEDYRRLGGYTFEKKAQIFLEGLCLENLPLTASVALLSGGQKRKLTLAGVLLRGVDLLLLDEPTNNLDLPALLWLEKYLLMSATTVLIASHDRRFLDHVVKKVIEIDREKRTAEIFTGNWSTFSEMKNRSLRRQKELYRAQEVEKVRVKESSVEKQTWVVRAKVKVRRDNDKMIKGFLINRSAQKHGATMKALKSRVERLDKVEKPFERTPLEFRLSLEKIQGKPAIELSKVIAGYPKGFQTAPLSITLSFGKCIAFLGTNGAGKSTLLKTITGKLKPLKGTVKRSPRVKFGDLMQEHENIPRDKTPFQYFAEKLRVHNPERVLLLLAQFQFTPEFAETKIGDLSPGERVRFILATLVEEGSTVLILDEPTNHLDLEAIEALEEALSEYPGTILLVTHDRVFLERMRVDETYILGKGKLTPIENFSTYEKKLVSEASRLLKRLEERRGSV